MSGPYGVAERRRRSRFGSLGAIATPMRPRLGSAVRPVGGRKSVSAAFALVAVAVAEIVSVLPLTAVIIVRAGMPVADDLVADLERARTSCW